MRGRLSGFGQWLAVAVFLAGSALGQSLPGDVNHDGYVDSKDISLITAGLNTSALGASDPRDINHDGKINIIDVRLASQLCTQAGCGIVTRVTLTPTATQLNIPQGDNVGLGLSLAYVSGDTVSRTLNITQTVTPSTGLSVTAAPGSLTFVGTSGQGFQQTLNGSTPGNYTITTSTQVGTGPVVTSTVQVTVAAATAPGAGVSTVSARPAAVPSGIPTLVTFTARASNFSAVPATLTLTGNGYPLSVTMYDDGASGGDPVAGDGVYTGQASVTLLAGSCVAVEAASGGVSSAALNVCGTSLPVSFVAPNTSNAFSDASGNPVAVANEILMGVTAGTTEAQVKALAAGIPATIVGALPEFQLYQLQLTPAPASLAALQSIITALSVQPNVTFAEVDGFAKTSSVFSVVPPVGSLPEDWALQLTRTDEAWNVAIGGCQAFINQGAAKATLPPCGNPTMVSIDSGVGTGGYPGKNYSGDGLALTSTADVSGHGSEVASVIGKLGFYPLGGYRQGMVWSGGVSYVDRVFTAKETGTNSGLISGFSDALAQQPSIINFSGSAESLVPALDQVVQSAGAKGINVVVAAGNGTPTKQPTDAGSYSPGYSGCASTSGVVIQGSVIVVGASSGDSDPYDLASYTNTGNCVSLLAPGGPIVMNVPNSFISSGLKSDMGTSMSTPMVSGAIALLLGNFPNLTPAQVKTRVVATANPVISGLVPLLGTPNTLLDVMETVFNGSFEDPNLSYSNQPMWTTTGTVASITNLPGVTCPGSPTCPSDRSRMARLSIGGAADTSATATLTSPTLLSPYQFQPTKPTGIGITFSYAILVPASLPKANGQLLYVQLKTDKAGTITLASIPVLPFQTAASGVKLSGTASGNSNVVWTQWVTTTVYATNMNTFNTYNLVFTLGGPGGATLYSGNNIVALIDGVKFTPEVSLNGIFVGQSGPSLTGWTTSGNVFQTNQGLYSGDIGPPTGTQNFAVMAIGGPSDGLTATMTTLPVPSPGNSTNETVSFSLQLLIPKNLPYQTYNQTLTVTLTSKYGSTVLGTIPVNPTGFPAGFDNLPVSLQFGGTVPAVWTDWKTYSFTGPDSTGSYPNYTLTFTLSGTPGEAGFGGLETAALITNVTVK